LDEDDEQGITNLVDHLLSLLKVKDQNELVTLEKFKSAIGTDENVLAAF
jgi:hypothetical protein